MTAARYTVEEVLGTGGFARVYRARDTVLGRQVALKVLLPHLAEDPQVAARFQQEARALAALHHPNIVTLYDVCEHDGRPAFAMELIEGEPLSTLLLTEGPLPLPRAAAIITALADALSMMHAAGIVHRDVKPANVMLERSGRPGGGRGGQRLCRRPRQSRHPPDRSQWRGEHRRRKRWPRQPDRTFRCGGGCGRQPLHRRLYGERRAAAGHQWRAHPLRHG